MRTCTPEGYSPSIGYMCYLFHLSDFRLAGRTPRPQYPGASTLETKMYVPQHFEETRIEELHRIINDHPLGTFVINGPNRLDANHLPFLLDRARGEYGYLLAHVARSNSVWTDVKDDDHALVMFRAADAYISPNWYPSTKESHRQVPTWNYQVVHVHGKI